MSYTVLFIGNFLKCHRGGASEVQFPYSDEKEIVHNKQQNWEITRVSWKSGWYCKWLYVLLGAWFE